jgi:hypothetical protein
MKRLLLSVRLVGIVLIGYTPNPLQTNQVTPALAEPLNMTRAVPLALQRVALPSPEQGSSVAKAQEAQAPVKAAPEASEPRQPARRQQARALNAQQAWAANEQSRNLPTRSQGESVAELVGEGYSAPAPPSQLASSQYPDSV